MIFAHIMGIPVEETFLQFGGVATFTVLAFAGRTRFERFIGRRRRR